ncbi:MAG: L-lysine cyclodeaminase [Synergistetes bacterium ADurb.Bin155]|jgi:ornithine cyclodeaminase/alanine dehydrogenase|nr:ornithine cyclodeaminase family protein [Synergistales bacterium]MBP8996101.1 ornithine cyclodeaminase family protein [Synergistales bacterium]NMD17445.1 ornithine cyclodeaminase family protein [Synergistaceae bacterium]OQB46517.1 MAG: L-lysine cyclodeaminase [Synergistetes bacterium ADurb.Bin155]HQL03102.1 ornithine cyclodeaminase family protein [Synergistales bacterium]
MSTVLLSRSEVKSLMTMKEVVEIAEKTFKGFGEGTTINPTKVGLDLGETAEYPPYEGFMNAMPAYVGWLDTAGIKWAGGFLGERKKLGLPYITSLILLIDPRVGNFKAVMDGEWITSMRTGAQTAVSLKYLHKGPSIRLGLYGAGGQGHTQTEAVAAVFDIEEVRVFDINRESALKYAEDMKDIVKGKVTVVDDPRDAAWGDAIVCVTQSKEKFLKNEWIARRTNVFPMGSYQEVDDDFILSADRVIVDHVGQCLHRGALKGLVEAGKFQESDIDATIGEVVAGKKPGRLSEDDRVLCIPIGTGAMDIAVATVILERAREKGLGGHFDFV